jgi:hypothetical protein
MWVPAAVHAQSLAQADSAWASGDRVRARRLYTEAVAENPSQSRAVFRLGQLAPSIREALPYFERYTILEPQDAWGHMALGDALATLGRTDAALAAYDRAERLAPGERDVALGRARAWELRAQRAPTIEPSVSHQSDSDGNRLARWGILGTAAPLDGMRFGGSVHAGELSDALEAVALLQARGHARLTRRRGFELQVDGGLDRFSGKTTGLWMTPAAEARLRWRAPMAGPALEVRLQHAPLAASPLLVSNRAVRSEARGSLELPIAFMRVRGGGRMGAIGTGVERSNTRTGADAAVAFRLGGQGELSAQYHRLSYSTATTAGYFAPRLVETREAGLYLERESGSGVALAVDLGAGTQRVAEHGANTGAWERALRGWGSVTVPFAPGRALWMEIEAYDAPFAPEGVTTAAAWRLLAVTAGLRWGWQ